MKNVVRVNGLSLTHIVTDDGATQCGKEVNQSWPATGDATCSRCITQPLLDEGKVDEAVSVVLRHTPTSDKRILLSQTLALADVVEARLNGKATA